MEGQKSIRKVLQIGRCTGITLPSEYLKQSEIDRGDYVEVDFRGEKAEIMPITTGRGAEEDVEE